MQEPTKNRASKTKNTLTFCPKDRIDHFHFGLGTIVTITEHYTMIAFDESGTRKFVTSMIKLSPSDTPPPARRVRRKKKAASPGRVPGQE